MKKIENKEKKSNKLEIEVCCRTRKEHYIMLALIVVIQHFYRKRFQKVKRVSFRRLVEMAIKEMEERGGAFYPFREKNETYRGNKK